MRYVSAHRRRSGLRVGDPAIVVRPDVNVARSRSEDNAVHEIGKLVADNHHAKRTVKDRNRINGDRSFIVRKQSAKLVVGNDKAAAVYIPDMPER